MSEETAIVNMEAVRPGRNEISPQDRKFVNEYLKDLSIASTMRRLGYEGPDADQRGYEILRRTGVIKAIQEFVDPVLKSMQVTAARVIEELKAVAFSDMGNFTSDGMEPGCMTLDDWKKLPPELTRQIEFVEMTRLGRVRIKLHSKIDALKALAKYTGLAKDQQNGQQSVQINLNITGQKTQTQAIIMDVGAQNENHVVSVQHEEPSIPAAQHNEGPVATVQRDRPSMGAVQQQNKSGTEVKRLRPRIKKYMKRRPSTNNADAP